jgi:hypothetical protein
MRVPKETSKYKLDLVGVQEFRWDRGGANYLKYWGQLRNKQMHF